MLLLGLSVFSSIQGMHSKHVALHQKRSVRPRSLAVVASAARYSRERGLQCQQSDDQHAALSAVALGCVICSHQPGLLAGPGLGVISAALLPWHARGPQAAVLETGEVEDMRCIMPNASYAGLILAHGRDNIKPSADQCWQSCKCAAYLPHTCRLMIGNHHAMSCWHPLYHVVNE